MVVWFICSLLLPLRIQPIITSGFGEFRLLRFHAGIDFSTHKRIGLPVYAPTDGVVYRVKASYYGYGKALYLMSQDSLIFVFAHLDRFNPSIERYVYKLQKAHRRYYLDIYPDTEFIINKGDLIGYTGESGAGGPHLHFEIRKTEFNPINPYFLYQFVDTIPPCISEIRVLDYHTGRIYDVWSRNQSGSPTLRASSPFVIEAVCYDPTQFGYKNPPYKIELYCDDKLAFLAIHDTLDYRKQLGSGVYYENCAHPYGEKLIRLANPIGIDIPVVKKAPKWYNLPEGIHDFKLSAEDYYGNADTVMFKLHVTPTIPVHYPDEWQIFNDMKLSFTYFGTYVSGKLHIEGTNLTQLDDTTYFLHGEGKWYINTPHSELTIYGFIIPPEGRKLQLQRVTLIVPEGTLVHRVNIFAIITGDTVAVYPKYVPIYRKPYIAGVTHPKEGIFVYERGWHFIAHDTGRVVTLGKFSILKDTVPPRFEFVTTTRDKIVIHVTDNLSGINGDNIAFYLDGGWEPIFYDYDNQLLIYRPLEPLTMGYHTYRLVLTDNLDNVLDTTGTVYFK